jgi:hypothetical protein
MYMQLLLTTAFAAYSFTVAPTPQSGGLSLSTFDLLMRCEQRHTLRRRSDACAWHDVAL